MILTPKSATEFIAQCFRSPIRLIKKTDARLEK